jgi:hypothetical protein
MSYFLHSYASIARPSAAQASARGGGTMRRGIVQVAGSVGTSTLSQQPAELAWGQDGLSLAGRLAAVDPSVRSGSQANSQTTAVAQRAMAPASGSNSHDSEPERSAGDGARVDMQRPMRGRGGYGRGGLVSRGLGTARGRGRGGAGRHATSSRQEDASDSESCTSEGEGASLGSGSVRGRIQSVRAARAGRWRGMPARGAMVARGRGGAGLVRGHTSPVFSSSNSDDESQPSRAGSPVSSHESSSDEASSQELRNVRHWVAPRLARGARGRGLARSAPRCQLSAEPESCAPELSLEESRRVSPKTPEEYRAGLGAPVRSWPHLHQDDIHGFYLTNRQGQEGFLTGSKDGDVRFTAVESGDVHYYAFSEGHPSQQWITALAVHESGRVAYGRRSGALCLDDLDSKETLASRRIERLDRGMVHSYQRIQNLTWVSPVDGEEPEPQLMLTVKDRLERLNQRLESTTVFKALRKGTCYGVAELAPGRLVTIEGVGLSIRSFEEGEWHYEALMRSEIHGKGSYAAYEPSVYRAEWGAQQQTIGHVRTVPGEPGKVVISQFDGSVSLIDCEGPRVGAITAVQEACLWAISDFGTNEQSGRRVWQTAPVNSQVWVCATDDGTLPIVDFRTQAVVKRLAPGGSRVSGVALSQDQTTLYAASCACLRDLSGGGGVNAYELRA